MLIAALFSRNLAFPKILVGPYKAGRRRLRTGNCVGENVRITSILEALAPLASSLEDRQAGLALAHALQALANMQPDLKPASNVLSGLVAVSTDSVNSDFNCTSVAIKVWA